MFVQGVYIYITSIHVWRDLYIARLLDLFDRKCIHYFPGLIQFAQIFVHQKWYTCLSKADRMLMTELAWLACWAFRSARSLPMGVTTTFTRNH